MEEVARRIYNSRVAELRERFEMSRRDLAARKGYLLAVDALRASRTPMAQELFLDAVRKALEHVESYPGRVVYVAPVPHGGEFVGEVLKDVLEELGRRGYHDKEVRLLPIEKLPGRRFSVQFPEEDHLLLLVDDAYGSGNTARHILSNHPNPNNARVIALSVPEKSDRYFFAKVLAALSYVNRATRGEPDMLDEMVEKKKNPSPPVNDEISRRTSWRVDDL